MSQKTTITILSVLVVVLLAVLGYMIATQVQKTAPEVQQEVSEEKNTEENITIERTPESTPDSAPTIPRVATSTTSQEELERIFGLPDKKPGTELYYSPVHGVGFTTYTDPQEEKVIIEERGNLITVADQSIEVFEKDPADTLEEAIQKQVLAGYDPEKCFVERNAEVEQRVPGYISAGIAFPVDENSDGPWWSNNEHCPVDYTNTNGVRYFLMNEEVPNKFLFVEIGQYIAAESGVQGMDNTQLWSWSSSIRILH